MKTCFTFLLAVLLLFSLSAQNITPEVLKKIQESYKASGPDKAMINALMNNDLKSLTLDYSNSVKPDGYFKYRVKTAGITDQKNSGRCWLFASLNVYRPQVIEKYNLSDFEFSQNYLFFYDQLEKANLFLEGILETADKPLDDRRVEWLMKNAMGDGGVWGGFANLVDKYGLVPAEIMPETKSSTDTRYMSSVLTTLLRQNALALREAFNAKKPMAELQQMKIKMLSNIYKVLVYNLGEPPTAFKYRFIDKNKTAGEYKDYTPLSFYKETVTFNATDYIMFMDDPSREYYKLYEIQYDRNVQEGINWKYINIPASEIKLMAIESIKSNEPMYFSCDVGKQYDKTSSTLDIKNYDYESVYGIDFSMNKKQRIQTFESGSTHGMTLVGVDVDASEKPVKWLIENSWGNIGFDGGHLIMTDEWFDEYMFRLVINKKYVPAKVLDVLKQKAIMLPPWDPMFMEDK
ncbi:MAG: aminopeptidase [Bacteroidetes bacterium GWF2_43_63]|nr:MAG: aminopeptidase [Bacteroidetes bacterium GWE2_42_42]OFY55010.1 MAG: aminopeptidase [Bacteroidetes bacterium GWF2_43_63]HBG69545.1 aminopeptidase [Bacteroidales bacterium]HCB60716.1 aminopeptidase [Bacteroidales bacterium]HCY23980.1 aminopeptidase [Bacteroidales bacterium]